jgi:hypothetical protein
MKKIIKDVVGLVRLMWRSRHDGFTGERIKALCLKKLSFDDRLKLVRIWAEAGEWAPKGVRMIGSSYPVRDKSTKYITSNFVDWNAVAEMNDMAPYFMSKSD